MKLNYKFGIISKSNCPALSEAKHYVNSECNKLKPSKYLILLLLFFVSFQIFSSDLSKVKSSSENSAFLPPSTILQANLFDLEVPIFTTVKMNQCGATLSHIYSSILAESVPANVTLYTFEITDPNSDVQSISTSNYFFQLINLPNYEYNTTYSVKVGLTVNGIFQGFGPSCNVSTPATNIIIPQCGTTLEESYSPIFITGPNFISSYEIMATNSNGSQTITRTQPFFQLSMFPLIYESSSAIGMPYTIQVRVKTTGDYGNWTTPCVVTTPDKGISVPVQSRQCNSTLPKIYTSILATTTVPNVTMYRFEIKDPNNVIQTIFTTNYWFQLTNLASYEYNTTYKIRIGLYISGVFQGYGRPCQVTTPLENIIIPQCGTTLANSYSPIFITGPNFISSYEIRVTNDLGTQTITRTQPFFSINMFTSIYNASVSRSNFVEVRVKTTGNYGPWTTSCEIITPVFPASSSLREGVTTSTEILETTKIIAYPNPFNDSFSLRLTGSMQESLDVGVYDMVGKLLETRSVNSSDLSSMQLGTNLPTGIYNVIVTSGDSIKSLRIIKR